MGLFIKNPLADLMTEANDSGSKSLKRILGPWSLIALGVGVIIGACCGLDCESCDARIATVKNDDELREKTAQKWSAMNNAPEITAATINCMGCRTDGMKFAYCSDYCEIRKCVSGKGFNTCGDCDELDSCQIVGAVLQHAPGARENLM